MPNEDTGSTAGLLLIATGLVIAGFVGVTVIAQQRARAIDEYASEIALEIAPRIDTLTAARGELHRASVAIRGALGTPPGSDERQTLDDAHRRLDQTLRTYGSAAMTPGERDLQREGADAAAAYLRLGDRIMIDLAAGRSDSAQTRASQLGAAFDEADAALQRLVRTNADRARLAGERIESARRHSATLSYTLHGLTALLTLLLMVVVARATHAASRAASERLHLENERKQLAEDRAAELEQFAARIAHDLKNPLAAVVLQLELGEGRINDPKRVLGTITRARQSVARALKIIDGILELACAGGRPNPDDHALLGEVVATVITDLSIEAERVGAQLSAPHLDDIEVACAAVPLFSVLTNLVGNAIKYIGHSTSALRRINLRVTPLPERVRVEIEDNGPGIPRDIVERIFEPYVRGTHLDEPGLGLGLALVRRIVTAHGGQVGVQSFDGHGSCFWFELPVFHSEQPAVLTH